MPTDNKSIIPIIESRYDSFTGLEKRIADYFIKQKESGYIPIKDLADKLYVSESSISRFSRKCGFTGYRELIYRFRESSPKEKSMGSVPSSSTTAVINTYQKLLTNTYSLTKESQIGRIVQYLNTHKRVVVCGIGSSGLAASEMESRFMRIGVDIDSLQDADRMRMQAVFLDKESLVIGLSISGTTESVLYLLQEGYARGAKTVLLTSNERSYLHKFCDEVVLCASTKYLDTGHTISPQFPLLLMIDIIYNEYAGQNPEEKSALHGETLRALHERRELPDDENQYLL